MKILVTGHTKGIGKAIFNYLQSDHDVTGASRSNNKPISMITEWFDPTVDIFINNAFDDDNAKAQAIALQYVCNIWNNCNSKKIISIGSISSDLDDNPYANGKDLLSETHLGSWINRKVSGQGPLTTIIRPGWVDTDRHKKYGSQYDALPTKSILEIISFIINSKYYIRDIAVDTY